MNKLVIKVHEFLDSSLWQCDGHDLFQFGKHLRHYIQSEQKYLELQSDIPDLNHDNCYKSWVWSQNLVHLQYCQHFEREWTYNWLSWLKSTTKHRIEKSFWGQWKHEKWTLSHVLAPRLPFSTCLQAGIPHKDKLSSGWVESVVEALLTNPMTDQNRTTLWAQPVCCQAWMQGERLHISGKSILASALFSRVLSMLGKWESWILGGKALFGLLLNERRFLWTCLWCGLSLLGWLLMTLARSLRVNL